MVDWIGLDWDLIRLLVIISYPILFNVRNNFDFDFDFSFLPRREEGTMGYGGIISIMSRSRSGFGFESLPGACLLLFRYELAR